MYYLQLGSVPLQLDQYQVIYISVTFNGNFHLERTMFSCMHFCLPIFINTTNIHYVINAIL